MRWLRWINALFAGLSGAAANVAGVLYMELAPVTAWGPLVYIGAAWVVAALAAAAWSAAPWWRCVLWLGSLGSALLAAYMFSFGFALNIVGHALAAVSFAAVALANDR